MCLLMTAPNIPPELPANTFRVSLCPLESALGGYQPLDVAAAHSTLILRKIMDAPHAAVFLSLFELPYQPRVFPLLRYEVPTLFNLTRLNQIR